MSTKDKEITKGEITVALAGNPNSGKTSVFNSLTGARQHVGNWPGVTVEKKEGHAARNGRRIRVVDLPGTYSLSAFSTEEIVARDYILNEKPHVVVDVVDASSLERNLYLAVQLIELETENLLIALNMFDVAESMGMKINIELLAELLGAPVVATVARKDRGMDDLLDAAVGLADGRLKNKGIKVSYGREIEEEIEKLESALRGSAPGGGGGACRRLAVKLLEGDRVIRKVVSEWQHGGAVLAEAERSRAHIASIYGEEAETVITERRYGFINGLIKEVLVKAPAERRTVSDRIDSVLVNRWLGLPVFAFFMFAAFTLTFALGDPPMRWLAAVFERLGAAAQGVLGDTLAGSLVVDGVIGGVGGVVVFLPNIMLLFLAIAVLEDTGYMARAAFIMDRVMHVMGLHGKSFIPMLMGIGCSVPAVMSTRMLESRKDRLVTMLVVPLVSCGARLPVYVLLAGAFFPGRFPWGLRVAGVAVFAMYAIGILVAVVMARVFRSTVFRGPDSPFVMELPTYRLPTLKSLLIHAWERAWCYLRKAGTIVLALTVVVWALMTFPGTFPGQRKYMKRLDESRAAVAATASARGGDGIGARLDPKSKEYKAIYAPVAALEREVAEKKLEYSFAGRFGRFVEPVVRPIGFDWRIAVSLFSGLAAKEVVVTTMGTFYSLDEKGAQTRTLQEALRADPSFNPLKAATFMLFVLLSVPCVATLAVIKRESGSWVWPLFSAGYHLTLAWVVCFIVWHAGLAAGIGV